MASSAGAAATTAGAARKVAGAAVLCVLLVLGISGRPAAAGLSLPAVPPGPIGQVGGCIQNCAEIAKTCSSFCQGLATSDLPSSKQCESLCGLQAGSQGATAPVDQAACTLCNRRACASLTALERSAPATAATTQVLRLESLIDRS